MQTIKALNTAAAFFVEVAMLIALAVAGFQAAGATVLRYVLSIGLPLSAMGNLGCAEIIKKIILSLA